MKTPALRPDLQRLADVAVSLCALGACMPLVLPLAAGLASRRYILRTVLHRGRTAAVVPLTTVLDARGRESAWASLPFRLLDLLVGRVSLVGPAPIRVTEAAGPMLRDERLRVRPGLVSPSVVRMRANLAIESAAAIDAAYASRRSLRGDVGVLARWAVGFLFGPAAVAATPDTFRLLDVRIDNLTTDDVLERIDRAIDRRDPLAVGFVNADCLNKACTDPTYRAALARLSLVLPDGIGVRIGASWCDVQVRENVNGTDLFPRLCARLAARGARLFLYGAAPGVAEAVAAWVRQHHPGVEVCGTHDGFTATPHTVASTVHDARPDVLLVALGAPRQERWTTAFGGATGAPVIIGVGGLFDFYSGRIPRAPMWMRELALEWVYRLWQEPGRMWRRYLIGNVVFLVRMARYRRRLGRNQLVEARS